jgi:predicted transcriptional regulator
MENKYLTLQTIFNLVKKDASPTLSIIRPREIIVHQNFPWDETCTHFNELQSEGLIDINQLSAAVISITDKGFQFIASLH